MHVVRNETEGSRLSSRSRAPLWRLLSESALLERARERNVDAFEELVGRTEAQLHGVAMRVVRNHSDAQEILQESYLSAWKNLPTFEGRSQFVTWMHRVVMNNSLMHLRSRNRHPEVGIEDVDDTELDGALAAREGRRERPDQQLQFKELLRHVEDTVDALPDALKEIFLLRDIREVSTEEAAAALGVSKQAAKTRLHRARRLLRQSLNGYLVC
jgi:RNA polymerase sigma-70 factor, ECF subfamily